MSDVDLCNSALRKVGSRDISAISDTTPGGAIAGDVLAYERDAELRAHVWNFAIARAQLPVAVNAPRFEYKNVFLLPSDWLRTVSVHNNDAGSGQVYYKQESILTDELLSNGKFDTTANWTLGTGWAISGGAAVKTAGSASDLSQTIAPVATGLYRIGYQVSGVSAGTVTPKFTGGTTVTGTAQSATGFWAEEFTALTGNVTFVLSASSTFNGTIDNVSVLRMDGAASHCLVCDADDVWLRYVRRVANLDQATPSFRQVVIIRMAKVFALGLANSATYYQLLDDEMRTAMRIAKSVDGVEDWMDPLPPGSWETARYASRDDGFSWARR